MCDSAIFRRSTIILCGTVVNQAVFCVSRFTSLCLFEICTLFRFNVWHAVFATCSHASCRDNSSSFSCDTKEVNLKPNMANERNSQRCTKESIIDWRKNDLEKTKRVFDPKGERKKIRPVESHLDQIREEGNSFIDFNEFNIDFVKAVDSKISRHLHVSRNWVKKIAPDGNCFANISKFLFKIGIENGKHRKNNGPMSWFIRKENTAANNEFSEKFGEQNKNTFMHAHINCIQMHEACANGKHVKPTANECIFSFTQWPFQLSLNNIWKLLLLLQQPPGSYNV